LDIVTYAAVRKFDCHLLILSRKKAQLPGSYKSRLSAMHKLFPFQPKSHELEARVVGFRPNMAAASVRTINFARVSLSAAASNSFSLLFKLGNGYRGPARD